MTEWWNEVDFHGWKGFRFMKKLDWVKKKLRNWNKEVFGDLFKEKNEIEVRISELDRFEAEGLLSDSLRSERSQLKLKLVSLVTKEEMLWRQKAKIKWVKEGDCNSKFFHRVANGRMRRNCIDKLELNDGSIIEEEGAIEKEIIQFFQHLYCKENVERPTIQGLNWDGIGRDKADWLERPFEEDEIKKAVVDCSKEKALGPDGFNFDFFHACWEIVKKDLMEVFFKFFKNGIVNRTTNATYICLIPKKSNSLKIDDFRPISLVSSLYKIIAKVLSLRLKEVLDSTISCCQSAFVKGRQILDAVLVANEVVEGYRMKEKECIVFKIDFQKAYDHVDWDFLEFVLDSKGFAQKWRRWIMGCLKSTNFSIMINGRPRGKFSAFRGLRQGDPLSHFLFILVADCLGRLIDRAKDCRLVEDFCVGKEIVIVIHLQFADDNVFFSASDDEKFASLVKVIRLFCWLLGLKVNLAKSVMADINCEEMKLLNLATEVGCEVDVR